MLLLDVPKSSSLRFFRNFLSNCLEAKFCVFSHCIYR